jgi:S-(hydroxymethyl)glutathione dehydrogenase/alcohol dehydrogenase
MRAAIFVGAEQPLAIEDVTPLAPGPNDVVVRVTASGLCHTDLPVLTGHAPRVRMSRWGTRGRERSRR